MTVPSSEAVPGEGAQARAGGEAPNQLSAVFGALGDATCRAVLRALRERGSAMTVQELAAVADVSLTSMYRKLDRLTAAGLVAERDGLDGDGHRRSRYRPAVDQIEVRLGPGDDQEVTLYRSAATLHAGDG